MLISEKWKAVPSRSVLLRHPGQSCHCQDWQKPGRGLQPLFCPDEQKQKQLQQDRRLLRTRPWWLFHSLSRCAACALILSPKYWLTTCVTLHRWLSVSGSRYSEKCEKIPRWPLRTLTIAQVYELNRDAGSRAKLQHNETIMVATVSHGALAWHLRSVSSSSTRGNCWRIFQKETEGKMYFW